MTMRDTSGALNVSVFVGNTVFLVPFASCLIGFCVLRRMYKRCKPSANSQLSDSTRTTSTLVSAPHIPPPFIFDDIHQPPFSLSSSIILTILPVLQALGFCIFCVCTEQCRHHTCLNQLYLSIVSGFSASGSTNSHGADLHATVPEGRHLHRRFITPGMSPAKARNCILCASTCCRSKNTHSALRNSARGPQQQPTLREPPPPQMPPVSHEWAADGTEQTCFVCADAAADAALMECGHGGLCAGEAPARRVPSCAVGAPGSNLRCARVIGRATAPLSPSAPPETSLSIRP